MCKYFKFVSRCFGVCNIYNKLHYYPADFPEEIDRVDKESHDA